MGRTLSSRVQRPATIGESPAVVSSASTNVVLPQPFGPAT
jgi:hypothetical protein